MNNPNDIQKALLAHLHEQYESAKEEGFEPKVLFGFQLATATILNWFSKNYNYTQDTDE